LITPEHENFTQSPTSAFHHPNPATNHHRFTHTNLSFVTEGFNLPPANKHPMFYISVFTAIGIGGGLVFLLNLIVQYAAALKASKKVFKQLLDTIIHATMQWFDTTQGRLLNRFSKVRDHSGPPTPTLSQFLRVSKQLTVYSPEP
jgi:ABC-type multidrug transport system fused ATPase/permease subunit